MTISSARWFWSAWLAVGTVAWEAAAPARGQCDPQELAKLIASDAATDDYFGFSVAVSGDTAVIGTYSDEHAGGISDGSAYIFVRAGEVWVQQAKLTASDAAANDQFGNSVAISGDTVVVGAHFDDLVNGSFFNEGSAYVFVRSGTVWTQQAKLIASDAAISDDFGFSVSLEGDTAVIGARINDIPGGPDGGSAYVFVRAGTVWTQQAMLTPSDPGSSDQFGWSVAVSGDTAAVGAHYDDHAAGTDAGSAYIFTRSGAAWTQQAKLIGADVGAGDEFGRSVALSGDTAVIGAYRDIYVVGANAAYVFVKPPGGWTNMTETAKLTASHAAAADSFGHSVAVSSNTVVVGAHLGNDAGHNNAGAAYVFVKPPGGWINMTETATLTASDAAASDLFGFFVALSGDTAVVGAWGDNHAGGSDAGSAYVFDLNCAGAPCPGDVDGDGAVNLTDLAILLAHFGTPSGATFADGDTDGDGDVDLSDLAMLLANFGSDCQ
ncbi:MAG: dockerin type I domain-containing protein [Phycisphaerae bacterium]